MNRTRKKLIQNGQPHERRHPLEEGGVRLTTFVPLQFKKRGIKKVVVGPAGVDAPVKVGTQELAISPNQDPTLLRALGRGFYWLHLLETGVVEDAAEIAEREGLHRTFINDYLRLAILAPDLVDAALHGMLPRTVTLLSLLRDGVPVCWQGQRSQIYG